MRTRTQITLLLIAAVALFVATALVVQVVSEGTR